MLIDKLKEQILQAWNGFSDWTMDASSIRLPDPTLYDEERQQCWIDMLLRCRDNLDSVPLPSGYLNEDLGPADARKVVWLYLYKALMDFSDWHESTNELIIFSASRKGAYLYGTLSANQRSLAFQTLKVVIESGIYHTESDRRIEAQFGFDTEMSITGLLGYCRDETPYTPKIRWPRS